MAGTSTRPARGGPGARECERLLLGQLRSDALDVVVHLAEFLVGHRLAGGHALLAVLVLDRARERMERSGLELAFELRDLLLHLGRDSGIERRELDHPFLVAAPRRRRLPRAG